MNAKQTALLEKAKRSVQAAELLLKAGNSDFATSRAYYALFYAAQIFLLEKGLSFSKHSGVISAFGEHFAAPGIVPKEFHRYLISAQAARNFSDYLTDDAPDPEEAEEHIRHAKEFVAWTEQKFDAAGKA